GLEQSYRMIAILCMYQVIIISNHRLYQLKVILVILSNNNCVFLLLPTLLQCSIPGFHLENIILIAGKLQWDPAGKLRSYPHFGCHQDFTSQAFQDGPADGKSESGTLGKTVHLLK